MMEKDIFIPDDCDIISQTPEKPKKVSKFKQNSIENKIVKSGCSSLNPVKKCGNMCYNFETDNVKICNPLSDSNNLKTNKTKLMSYIYHSHKEFLCYTNSQIPKQNNMRLVGLLKRKSQIYLLESCQVSIDVKNLWTVINFENATSIPNSEECIEVYGCLDFQVFSTKTLPILKVHFWKIRNKHTILEYINLLEKQQYFVPNEYRETIPVHNNSTYLETANDITLLFDDCNESVLRNNITCLENHIQEMLNISFDTSS